VRKEGDDAQEGLHRGVDRSGLTASAGGVMEICRNSNWRGKIERGANCSGSNRSSDIVRDSQCTSRTTLRCLAGCLVLTYRRRYCSRDTLAMVDMDGNVDACPGGERRLDIAFVTARDPLQMQSFSGTHYFMLKALQKRCGEVYCLGPVRRSAIENAERVFNKASRLLLKKGYDHTHSIISSKRYARVFRRKLAKMHADLVFAPAAASEIAHLDTTVPIVYSSDGTFAAIKDHYPGWDFLDFSTRRTHLIEKSAIRKASLLIYPSQYAARSAVRDYQADESKIHIIPFGANLEVAPVRDVVLHPKPRNECRLLFVGVDWVRKGGAIAVETLAALRAKGIPAHLTICGCIPPGGLRAEGLEVIPSLDKRSPAEHKRLQDLYLSSHFFLLPTRADLSPIVLCEANAFGVPVVTSEVGGIPDIVTEGHNGLMLPLSASGQEYANAIADIWYHPDRYSELAHLSRKAFEERLNWDVWACSVGELLTRLAP